MTVKVNVAVPVPLALVALIVTLLTPVALAVPEMIPVPVSTDKPEGSPVAL